MSVRVCSGCGVAMTNREVECFVDECEICASFLCTEGCATDCMADHRGEE